MYQKSYIIFCLFTIVMFWCGLIAKSFGGDKQATIYLKDGSIQVGRLIELTPQHVKIDPKGAISLQVFSADQIDFVTIEGQDEKIFYPIESRENNSLDKNQYTLYSVKQKVYESRKWSILGSYGTTGDMFDSQAGFGAGDYSTGGILQLGVRYHFLPTAPGGKGTFAEFSYHHTSVSTEIVTYDYDLYYSSQSVEKKEVGISNYSLNLGLHTASLGNNSYLDLLGGISLFSMNGGEDIGLTNSALGVRLGVGAVIGIQPGFNLLINSVIDLTYMGSEEKRTIIGTTETRPKTVGGIYFINFGVMYDF